jgi:hypothetical protein
VFKIVFLVEIGVCDELKFVIKMAWIDGDL